MKRMKQAYFLPLSTQGNIYSIVPLSLINDNKKLLVSTLKRQVFTFEYVENSSGILTPTTKEIPFTYIPNGAEIIAIDAFNKSLTKNEFVIGIAIIKQNVDSNSLETYLNIYTDESFNLDSIAQNCLSIKLNFIPYHLNHTFLITWTETEQKKEIVFLLSGSDSKMHIFREVNDGTNYKELDKEIHFPEFYDIPGIIMWCSVLYHNNYEKRITAFGCENGYLRLTVVDTKTDALIRSHAARFGNAISQVKFYSDYGDCKVPDNESLIRSKTEEQNESEFNLIVVNTINPSVLFRNVIHDGLENVVSLRRNDLTSVTTCSSPADLDFNGVPGIILGNSLHELLFYKNVTTNHTTMKLHDVMKLVGPIFQIFYMDLTGDGVKELIIFTIKGLYVYQHEQSAIEKALKEKLEKLTIPDVIEVVAENS